MVAYMAGNAGGPPPPTQREANLLARLRSAQAVIRDLRAFIERDHANGSRDGDYWLALRHARSVLATYDQFAEEPLP